MVLSLLGHFLKDPPGCQPDLKGTAASHEPEIDYPYFPTAIFTQTVKQKQHLFDALSHAMLFLTK